MAGAGGILRNTNRYSLNLPLRQRGVVELRSPLRLTRRPGVGTKPVPGLGSSPSTGKGDTTTSVPIVNPDKLAPVPTPQVSTPNTPLRVKVDVSLPPAPAVKTVVLLNTFEAGQAVGKEALMSAATGIASVTVAAPALPGGAYVLTIEAQLLGLTGKPFATTLHAPAFLGQTGPAVFRLDKYVNGTYNIPASLYRLMSSGQAYINVRTAKYPSGELRGQICFENCGKYMVGREGGREGRPYTALPCRCMRLCTSAQPALLHILNTMPSTPVQPLPSPLVGSRPLLSAARPLPWVKCCSTNGQGLW